MKFVITGGSGFLGNNLARRLIKNGHQVTIFDHRDLKKANRLLDLKDKIEFCKIDLENHNFLNKKLVGFDFVVHFSASANTQLGMMKPDVDLKRGILSTFNVLEAMRVNGIKKIVFGSSPAVYGNQIKFPISEDVGNLLPISLYGAAKLASEGLICAFCNLFDFKAWIFRFGNVVGPDMNRGVIIDFIKKLKQNSTKLEILGSGTQKKDVIFIKDCIDGILFSIKKSNKKINIFNLSSGTTITVIEIAKIVVNEMNLTNVKIKKRKAKSGWKGDPEIIHLNINKLKNLGWSPKYTANDAVKLTVKSLINAF